MKIVYSDPKTGRTAQAEIANETVAQLLNLKVGDTLDGGLFGLSGYRLRITGGSDSSGFPMNKNAHGSRKFKVLRQLSSGKSGRRTVVGNVVSTTIAQINAVIVEYGSKPVEEIFPPIKPKEKAAAPAAEEGKKAGKK